MQLEKSRLSSSIGFYIHWVLFTIFFVSFLVPANAEESISEAFFKPVLIDLSQEDELLNPRACKMEDMIRFYQKELGIDDAKVTFVRQRMRNPRRRGFIQQKGDGQYLLVLAKGLEPSELRITIAHELVHVRQFVQGSIDLNELDKDYLERSFEDEAFRLSMPMAIKFYQVLDCQNKILDVPSDA